MPGGRLPRIYEGLHAESHAPAYTSASAGNLWIPGQLPFTGASKHMRPSEGANSSTAETSSPGRPGSIRFHCELIPVSDRDGEASPPRKEAQIGFYANSGISWRGGANPGKARVSPIGGSASTPSFHTAVEMLHALPGRSPPLFFYTCRWVNRVLSLTHQAVRTPGMQFTTDGRTHRTV